MSRFASTSMIVFDMPSVICWNFVPLPSQKIVGGPVTANYDAWKRLLIVVRRAEHRGHLQ